MAFPLVRKGPGRSAESSCLNQARVVRESFSLRRPCHHSKAKPLRDSCGLSVAVKWQASLQLVFMKSWGSHRHKCWLAGPRMS